MKRSASKSPLRAIYLAAIAALIPPMSCFAQINPGGGGGFSTRIINSAAADDPDRDWFYNKIAAFGSSPTYYVSYGCYLSDQTMGWQYAPLGGSVTPATPIGCSATEGGARSGALGAAAQIVQRIVAEARAGDPTREYRSAAIADSVGGGFMANAKAYSLPFTDVNLGACRKGGSPRRGDPIDLATGNNFQQEMDSSPAAAGPSFTRYYNSAASWETIAQRWTHSFDTGLDIVNEPNGGRHLRVREGSGRSIIFRADAQTGGYVSVVDVSDRVVPTANNGFMRTADGKLQQFDSAGRITLESRASGGSLTFAYGNNGLVTSVTDHFGRKVVLVYDDAARLSAVQLPEGQSVAFEYSNDGRQNLLRASYADGSSRSYRYENAAFPSALTALVDENGRVFQTWGYDNRTGQANGNFAGTGADRITIDKGSPLGAVVTYWNGRIETILMANVNGAAKLTSSDQPAGSGCGPSSRKESSDANGNPEWKEDFNGYRVCFAHDLSRNLERTRVEGLGANTSCGVLVGEGAVLPDGARKVSTLWHSLWPLDIKVAEPRRLTTKVYNGQPDPFSGGATASCAPPGATLPDGSPIAVLCKQVEQATTDANGSKGMAAVVDASVPVRVQRWTYNEFGQLTSYTDPTGNTTTYAYYADTTVDHTRGDLASVTNAKHHVTAYGKYNAAGLWTEMTDANAVVTTRSFDERQRLKWVRVGSVQTAYDYWPTGLLKTVTLPDGSFVSYAYDDAHRLTSVTDNLGNSKVYTLDDGGNRIGEDVRDPSGTLAKTLTRLPDALNRIQLVTGRQ